MYSYEIDHATNKVLLHRDGKLIGRLYSIEEAQRLAAYVDPEEQMRLIREHAPKLPAPKPALVPVAEPIEVKKPAKKKPTKKTTKKR